MSNTIAYDSLYFIIGNIDVLIALCELYKHYKKNIHNDECDGEEESDEESEGEEK